MDPRGVPLLADHVEPFVGVLGQFRGENPRGYKVAEDVYHLFDSEKVPAGRRRDPDGGGDAGRRRHDGRRAAAARGRGSSPSRSTWGRTGPGT